MKLIFDATLEDYVDVSVRSSPLTQEYYVMLAFSILGNTILSGFIAYCVWANIYLTSIFAVGGIAYVVAANYNIRERRARKLYRDTYRIKEAVPVEVEVSDAGLSFRQFGATIINDWNTVRVEEETDDAIYFRVALGQLCAVRKRAFATEAEKSEFLTLVNRYWSEATAACWNRSAMPTLL